VTAVEGTLERADGTTERLTAGGLAAAPETALRLLSLAVPALAVALLLARLS
jgi:hypothetical protein